MALFQQPPPQPFIGGAQPLAPREFTPPSGVAAAAQPPRRTLPETVLAAWRTPSRTPIISGWQVQEYVPDNPPFGLEAWLGSTLAQWQVTPWTQQRSAKLIQEAVSAAVANPSFDQSWVWGVLNQWQVPAPIAQARKLSPGIPGQSVDDPPRVYRADNRVIRLWDSPAPFPTQKGKISSGIPGQSVDNPPNRAAELRAALISWQPPAPAPTFYARFTQGIDNPPFGLKPQWRWDAPLTAAQVQYARYIQQAAIVGADNPPFGLEQPWGALRQWQARALTPVQQALLVQSYAPDNPPFGMPQDWLWGTLGQWQTTPPTWVQYKRLIQELVQAGADNPPFGLLRPWNALGQWQTRALTPIQQALLVQEFVPSDNPPFGMPPDWLWHTLTQWQVVTRIVQARKLSPGIPGQSVDRPPTRSSVNLLTEVKAWEPIILLPERPLYLAQPFVIIPVDNPPFGMPPDWLYTVLTAAWKPGEPLPKVLQKILQEGPPPPDVLTYRKIITLCEDRITSILG